MDDEARQGDVNAAEMVKGIESDPCGAMRSLLGTELWGEVMDCGTPLPDDFARSAYTALNTIGVLEGASGLRKWLAGRSAWGAAED